MKYELYHHGILGQKWGVRNGPPYPLDASNRPKKSLYTKMEDAILSLDDWSFRTRLRFDNWVTSNLFGDTRYEQIKDRYDQLDWLDKYMMRRVF